MAGGGCFSEGFPWPPALLTGEEDSPRSTGALGSAGVRDDGQVSVCAEASTDGGEERHGAREGGSRHI